MHRATLLHYVAANGVEGHRQQTPANAAEVATLLLRGGAEVDALADMYGGRHTTLSMVASSAPVARAGLQVPLIDVLLGFGAAIEGKGLGTWVSPVMTALAFGYAGTARALAARGARVDSTAAAAGLGHLAEVQRLLPAASADDRHRALALAAQHGHADIVAALVAAGEDPDCYNPPGNHAHSTPLHQAAWSGHDAVVRVLVEHGARLDIRDTVYDATPLEWAIHAGHSALAEDPRHRVNASGA